MFLTMFWQYSQGLEDTMGAAGAAGAGPLKYEGKKKVQLKKGKGKK